MSLDSDYFMLYRADRKGNKTFPEKYYSDGLFTKQLNSGDDPEPHRKYGWLKTIVSHIQPLDTQGWFIYDTTQFLSFTTEQDRAFYFLSHGSKDRYRKCDRSAANGFLFSAAINKNDLKMVSKGIYTYTYKCNYGKTHFDPDYAPLSFIHSRCNICSQFPGAIHGLLLIDAKEYLSDKRGEYLWQYELACQDSEFLIMPMDIMHGPNSIGFQSRVQIADFWSINFFQIEVL